MALKMSLLNGTIFSITEFKSWAMGISSMFPQWGWVQTTDTGQVNWAGLTTVPGINGTNNGGSSSYVYELWRMNDALASQYPVVIRIQYGTYFYTTGTGYPNSCFPAIQIAIGTGSNGTGGLLNGSIWASSWSGGGTNSDTVGATSANYFECYFNGGPNWFAMLMWRNHPGGQAWYTKPQFYCAVERGKDANGNDIGDHATIISAAKNEWWWRGTGNDPSALGYPIQQTIFSAGQGAAGPVIGPGLCSFIPWGSWSSSFGAYVPLSPVYPWIGRADYPLLSTVVGKVNDFADTSIATTSLYGQSHNYFMSRVSSFGTAATFYKDGSGTSIIGMRAD